MEKRTEGSRSGRAEKGETGRKEMKRKGNREGWKELQRKERDKRELRRTNLQLLYATPGPAPEY